MTGTVVTGQTVARTATGGGRTCLQWTVVNSGSSGSIDPATGVYTAGGHAGTDVVRVTDSLGNTSETTIIVAGSNAPRATDRHAGGCAWALGDSSPAAALAPRSSSVWWGARWCWHRAAGVAARRIELTAREERGAGRTRVSPSRRRAARISSRHRNDGGACVAKGDRGKSQRFVRAYVIITCSAGTSWVGWWHRDPSRGRVTFCRAQARPRNRGRADGELGSVLRDEERCAHAAAPTVLSGSVTTRTATLLCGPH